MEKYLAIGRALTEESYAGPFEGWWATKGHDMALSHDSRSLAVAAFKAAWAMSGNYTADKNTAPTEVVFNNGRHVKIMCEHKWEWVEEEHDTNSGGYYECVHCGETKADDEPDPEPEMSEFV